MSHARAPASTLTDEELLSRLIAFDSTSSRDTAPIVDFICEYLDVPGIEIIRSASEDARRHNVIAIAGPPRGGPPGPPRSPGPPPPRLGESREGLILCGHIDTVPATESGWTCDPFRLTKRDGRYYGRGTADMKGFDALAINMLRSVDAAELAAPLVLMLTYDEELGSLGAKRLVETWPGDRSLPRSAIIGEPTSLAAVRMHKGHLKMRITIHGRAAHSGSPHLGANAIEPAWELLCGLSEMRKHLEQRRGPTSRYFKQVPHSVLAVTRIAGGGAGNAPNVVPDRCEIDLGIRLLPGEHTDGAVAMVMGITRSIAGPEEVEVEVNVLNDNPPLLTDAKAPVHRALCKLLKQSGSRGVSFASDAGWLAKLGIDCVLFGPGSIAVAHKPDEWLPIDEFREAKDLLQSLVRQFSADRVMSSE